MNKILIIIILFIGHQVPLCAQASSASLKLKKEAFRLFQIANEKSKQYKEVDSIYYYLARSLELVKKIEHDSLRFILNNNLIYWHLNQNEENEFRKYLEENIVISHQYQNKTWESICQINYAKFYEISMEEIPESKDSIEHYYFKAIEGSKEVGDHVHLMVASNSLAEFYINQKVKPDKVESLLEQAILVSQTDDETQILANDSKELLARFYLSTEKYDQSISILKELTLLKADAGYYKWIYSFLSEAYEKKGDYKNAYRSGLKVKSFSDSLAAMSRNEAIQKAKYTFDTEQKEKLIDQLKENAQLKEKTSIRQKIIIRIILFGLFLITALGFLLRKTYLNRIKADKALLSAQKEMTEIKSQLFTNITHEFRTPLTVILGMVNKIKGNFQERTLIKKNSEQLLEMVNQMLDLSRSEAGSLELKFIQSDIIAYLKYLTESFESLAKKKEIKMTFYSESDQIFMDFDPKQIKHIHSNLVSNAIKFTPKDGQIIVHLKEENDQLIWKVKDNGMGMNAHQIPHIFDRFYQINNHKTKNMGGTGIGLALVKELIDLMKGEIRVESLPEQGTSIFIQLPIDKQATIQSLQFEYPTLETAAIPGSKLSWTSSENDPIALIIEDNEDVQTYIESCISSQYKIETASDGQEGIAKALELIPDIIISDIMMPIMDGYQVTQTLKEDFRTNHIPIILLTAKATSEDRIVGLGTGADAYLTKPFNEDELHIRLKNLTTLRKNLQTRYAEERAFQNRIKTDDPFMIKLLEVLEDNYKDEGFGVKEFVNALKLSRMQLHRKIKALTNMSTTKFLNQFRLEKAYENLLNKKLNIAEIAYANGFNDPSYFTKLFSEKYGVTPSEIRP